MVTVAELRELAAQVAVIEGEPLSVLDESLIRLGVVASVTSLDRGAIKAALVQAYSAGATQEQMQEILSLVSGLGIHTLMVASPMVLEQASVAGESDTKPLSDAQQELWEKHVGADPFWATFEREMPGFLRSMLLLSSDQFVAFFDYCAVPWKTRSVRGRIKELAAMACDATPAHRFLPGFRLHLANAVSLGAGSKAIAATLDIAAAAPLHAGTD